MELGNFDIISLLLNLTAFILIYVVYQGIRTLLKIYKEKTGKSDSFHFTNPVDLKPLNALIETLPIEERLKTFQKLIGHDIRASVIISGSGYKIESVGVYYPEVTNLELDNIEAVRKITG